MATITDLSDSILLHILRSVSMFHRLMLTYHILNSRHAFCIVLGHHWAGLIAFHAPAPSDAGQLVLPPPPKIFHNSFVAATLDRETAAPLLSCLRRGTRLPVKTMSGGFTVPWISRSTSPLLSTIELCRPSCESHVLYLSPSFAF
jgi:hypothetical protein